MPLKRYYILAVEDFLKGARKRYKGGKKANELPAVGKVS